MTRFRCCRSGHYSRPSDARPDVRSKVTWTDGSPLIEAGLPLMFTLYRASNPTDVNGDGIVNVDDLLIILNNWGPCEDCDDCPADITDDCDVGVDDLLIILNSWG